MFQGFRVQDSFGCIASDATEGQTIILWEPPSEPGLLGKITIEIEGGQPAYIVWFFSPKGEELGAFALYPSRIDEQEIRESIAYLTSLPERHSEDFVSGAAALLARREALIAQPRSP